MAEQAFAQAMDRATSQQAPVGGPAVTPAEFAVPPAVPAGGDYGGDYGGNYGATGAPIDPLLASPDPLAAQAEIDAYMRAVRSRKARKRTIYAVIAALIIAVIGGLMYHSSQQEAARQEAAKFLKAFNDVDNGSMAGFWRCNVRAKHKDVHLEDPSGVVDGLDGVFRARPKSQPDYVKRKCLPLLKVALGEFSALKPPADFAPPLAELKAALPKLQTVFDAYIGKMEQAKELTSNEKEIMAANTAFHATEQTEPTKTVGYVNLLLCAYPDLPKMARKVTQPPDVQPLVEAINIDLKGSAKGTPSPTELQTRVEAFADKLRKTCFPKLNSIERAKDHTLIVRKMSGDNRDGQALQWAFKKANRGFFKAELDAIGTSFVAYRNGVVKVRNTVKKFKKE